MSNTVPVSPTTGTTSADPAKLTPEAVIEQLRSMTSQIGEVAPLTREQRTLVKASLRQQKQPIVEASINVMAVIDNVPQAIGQPLVDVRQLQTEATLWDGVIDAARGFLKGLEGANLTRRHRLALIGTQAYTIGTTLAKDPANAALVPHVEQVKQLKGLSRRKKATKAPQPPTTPAPAPTPAAPVPAHDMSTTPKA
jgi:hypothetical protein